MLKGMKSSLYCAKDMVFYGHCNIFQTQELSFCMRFFWYLDIIVNATYKALQGWEGENLKVCKEKRQNLPWLLTCSP